MDSRHRRSAAWVAALALTLLLPWAGIAQASDPVVSPSPADGTGSGSAGPGPAGAGVVVDLDIVPRSTRLQTVPIRLRATDGTGSGIRAWYLSEDPTPPALGAPGWRTIRPGTFTLSTGEGVHTVHAWARSRSGVRSAVSSDTITVDRTDPTVGLTGPATATRRMIPVTLAWDDPLSGGTEPASGVTRWAVVSGATAPGRHSDAWKPVAPTSYRLPAGNGTKTVSAFARDAAGNVSAASTITVDLHIAGPALTIVMPAATSTRKARVRVAATDPGGTGIAGFHVSTNGTLPAGKIPWRIKPATVILPPGDGPKTVYAWVKDDNGTISPRVEGVIVLDTALPVVTLSAAATATAIELPVTVGATDAGSGVVRYAVVNGTAVPADASGAWSTTPPTSLRLSYRNGTKRVTAFARDAAGNISAPVTLSVEMTLPAPSIDSFTMPLWSKARQTAVTVRASDPGGTGIDGWYLSESPAAPSVTGSGWVVAPSNVMLSDAQGAHTVHVWVKDRNGSISERAQTVTNLDTIKPVVVLGAPWATRTSAIGATIETTETGSGATAWALVSGTNPPATGFPEWRSAPPTGITLPGADGSKTISAFARDLAGNVSAAATRVVIVDTVAPTATLGAPAAADATGIAITVGGSDNATGVTGYAVVAGSSTPAEDSPAWSATPPDAWVLTGGDGPRQLSAFVRDGAGNVSPAASRSVLLDRTAPTVWLDRPTWSNSTTPWVSLSEDDQGGVGVTHWAVVAGTTQPAPGSAAWVTTRPGSVSVAAGDGAKTVSAWARDGLGHVSAAHTRTITIDTVPPTVSLGSLPARTSARTIAVTMSGADDASGVARWAIGEGATAPGWGSGAWKTGPLSSYAITGAEGTRTLRAWTRDVAGNVSLASTQSIVLDTTAPTVSLIAPAVTTSTAFAITVTATDGGGTGVMAYAVVEGVDAPAPDAPAWNAGAPTSFTVGGDPGPRTLSAFAKDLAGNISVASSATVDLQGP